MKKNSFKKLLVIATLFISCLFINSCSQKEEQPIENQKSLTQTQTKSLSQNFRLYRVKGASVSDVKQDILLKITNDKFNLFLCDNLTGDYTITILNNTGYLGVVSGTMFFKQIRKTAFPFLCTKNKKKIQEAIHKALKNTTNYKKEYNVVGKKYALYLYKDKEEQAAFIME